MVAQGPVYPASPRRTLLTQEQGVPDGRGERVLAQAAVIDTTAVLMSTFMFLGCRGWDAPVMMPAPSTGSFSRFCIFLHLYLLIISNIDPTKIDDPKPDYREGPPGYTDQTSLA